MSFVTQVLDLGGGGAEFRVAIEGCPLEFCTSHVMAELLPEGSEEDLLNTSGVRRVDGLLREGLSFTESAYLPGADYKATLGSVTIEDTDESVAWNKRAASSVFSRVPSEVAFLVGSVDHVETTWTVLSSAGLEIGRVYHVDTEAVRVDAIVDEHTIEVTRAMYRTTSQWHFTAYSSSIGDRTMVCAMFNAPPTYRGRRVWIYGHALSTSTGLPDAGSLIARGVIAGAPSLADAMTWSFSLASLVSLLDTEIGVREDAGAVRGIYYPGATPYLITINRMSGPDRHGSTWDSRIIVRLVGFWGTQDQWCEELTARLNEEAVDAGWTETFSARSVGRGWELYVTTAATSGQRYLFAEGGSVIDGIFSYRGLGPSEGPDFTTVVVSASTEYRFLWNQATDPLMGWNPPIEGVRGIPRSASYAWDIRALGTSEEIADFPWYRLHVGNVAGLSTGMVFRCDVPEAGTRGSFAWEAIIAAVDPDRGSITWSPDSMRRVSDEEGTSAPAYELDTVVTPASLPTITFMGFRLGWNSHVGDMLLAVCNEARERANSGLFPFILESDFDSFDTIDARVRLAAAGRSWLLQRTWSFAKPVRFSDVIKHELRLVGCYLATTVTGAITIRPLTEELTLGRTTIGSEDLIIDDGFGDLVVEPDGLLTGLTIRTGYDAMEDDHTGRDVEVTALGALAYQRKRIALEIAPKSRSGGSEPTPEDLISHLYGTISFWSRHRMQVRLNVSLRYYDVRIGDPVHVTSPQLPYDGERAIDGGGGGMVAKRGLVVARSWRFDEPQIGLTVVFMGRDIVGYTPAGRVLSQSGSGTDWTVTLAAAEYGPGEDVHDADFFQPPFKVRLIEYDVDTPTVIEGTVVSQSGDDVELALDSTWTPGSSTWNLHFAKSTTPGLTTAQRDEYAFIAADDGRVYLDGTSVLASRFAP